MSVFTGLFVNEFFYCHLKELVFSFLNIGPEQMAASTLIAIPDIYSKSNHYIWTETYSDQAEFS